jgi:hypothetical protein
MRALLALALTAVLSGCAHKVFFGDPGIVTYYDRNHDGRVDFEFHDNGGGDTDWALNDRNFDGFYDLWVRYGIVMGTDPVHIPVAKDVKITKGRLPVVITE